LLFDHSLRMRLAWAGKEADKQQQEIEDDYEGIFDYNYANEEVEHDDDYEDDEDEDDGNSDGAPPVLVVGVMPAGC
jgi:hypothetical protein